MASHNWPIVVVVLLYVSVESMSRRRFVYLNRNLHSATSNSETSSPALCSDMNCIVKRLTLLSQNGVTVSPGDICIPLNYFAASNAPAVFSFCIFASALAGSRRVLLLQLYTDLFAVFPFAYLTAR